MQCEVIQSFIAGTPVPDWLLSIDPSTPNSEIRGGVRFGFDCHLVKTDHIYFILPDRYIVGGSILVIDSAETIISATNEPVMLPNGIQTFFMLGDPRITSKVVRPTG